MLLHQFMSSNQFTHLQNHYQFPKASNSQSIISLWLLLSFVDELHSGVPSSKSNKFQSVFTEPSLGFNFKELPCHVNSFDDWYSKFGLSRDSNSTFIFSRMLNNSAIFCSSFLEKKIEICRWVTPIYVAKLGNSGNYKILVILFWKFINLSLYGRWKFEVYK